MKNTKKFLALILALLTVALAFTACATVENNKGDTPKQTTTGENGETEAPAEPDKSLEIKIMLLNGTTAMGAAELIKKGEDNEMNYQIETVAAADQITAAIVSGDAHIAALPTNAAAKLYKASGGKVKLLAVNTLGVLYLLSNGEDVTDMNSLKGKTIYLPGAGSNPEYITAALLGKYGLVVGEDVTLDTTTYNSPDALTSAIASGAAKLAVLPEPKVTVATSQNADIKVAMDFTALWEEKFGENTLAQGCLVVNTAFAEAHSVEVNRFLDDYKKSVETVAKADEAAAQLVVDAGILPKLPIAQKALPKCNICFVEGKAMKEAIAVFYETIYTVDPESIKALPDDGFYYVR